MRDADGESGPWRQFAGRRNPIVLSPWIGRDGLDRVVIACGWLPRIFGLILILAAGGTAAGMVVAELSWPALCVSGGLGSLVGVVGLGAVLHAGRVTVDASRDELVLRGGFWPWPRLGRFALSDVRLRLRRRELSQQTQMRILVHHRRHRGLIRLVRGTGWEIARIAEAWPDADARVSDGTAACIELPDGGRLDVSTSTTAPGGSNFEGARLCFASPTRA